MRRGATLFAEPYVESKGETVYLFFPMVVDARRDPRFADGGPVQTFSEGGPAQVRLAQAIAERMDLTGEREADAERNLVRTEAGLELWEVARQERMEYQSSGAAAARPSRPASFAAEIWLRLQRLPFRSLEIL